MKKKRGFLFFIVFIFILSSINAQTETPFDAESSIVAPPPPPEEELEMVEKLNVVFELKDYDSKNLINDIHVNLEIIDKGTNEKTSTLKYVGNNGLTRLRLYKGEYDITLKVDKIDTNGRDYFITFDQSVDNDVTKTVYLLPVGSVTGSVYEKEGDVVKGAQIKFECGGNYGEMENKISDEFGSFSSYWLPVGSCRVFAIYDNKVGYMDIEIKKGELNNIDINLVKEVISGFNLRSMAILILVGLVFMFIGAYYVNKKKKEKIEDNEIIKEEIKGLSSRTKDIIKTLKEKERTLVDFLLENNYKSTQAKIRYATGIPKTSLARILVSLELKKIVKIEKIGKLKKVELTAWFLGEG